MAEFDEQEAAGSDVLSAELTQAARTRLSVLLAEALNAAGDRGHHPSDVAGAIEVALAHRGVSIEQLRKNGMLAVIDRSPTEEVVSVLEAFLDWAPTAGSDTRYYVPLTDLTAPLINGFRRVLREERIAWDLIEGQFMPMSSRELHEEVVRPALSLLARGSRWSKVERAYRKAIEEPDPGDAITDAGTALQEVLTELGFQGNNLGALISDAKTKGWILGHDEKLLSAVATFISADRSQLGDAHHVRTPTREDAWLAIHVTGAFILRMIEGRRPDISTRDRGASPNS